MLRLPRVAPYYLNMVVLPGLHLRPHQLAQEDQLFFALIQLSGLAGTVAAA